MDKKVSIGCNILFKGFKGINIEKLLMILQETHKYCKEMSFRQVCKAYISSRWYDRYDYKYIQKAGNKFIAFYSDYYFRNDHLSTYVNFIKEFQMFDYVIPIRLPKDRINLKRGFIMSMWDVYNFGMLSNVDISFKEKIFFLRVIGLIALYCRRMGKYLDTKEYVYGLVYNDSNPYENILVQHMKRKGIYTATLQHGIFDKHGCWRGLEFRASVSDDFLAWNYYTKDLAMECGISKEKIKVLGMPRYINSVVVAQGNQKGIFSVILGGKLVFDENKRLIEFANNLSRELGLKYFVRYHPTYEGNEYDMLVDRQFYIWENRYNDSIVDMCEQSDFSLVGSATSMIIDLIYLKQPFLQYFDQWDGKKYKKRTNYFRNYNELKEQMRKLTSQSEEMFYYYCTTAEVKKSYNEYFLSLHYTNHK